MPFNKANIKKIRLLAKKTDLSPRDPLLRLTKKYPKGTAQGNACRTSLARYIKRKRKPKGKSVQQVK
jgi:hypothetical protein